jgi:hypothetical protein
MDERWIMWEPWEERPPLKAHLWLEGNKSVVAWVSLPENF